jgi:hypothetical protein
MFYYVNIFSILCTFCMYFYSYSFCLYAVCLTVPKIWTNAYVNFSWLLYVYCCCMYFLTISNPIPSPYLP